MEHHFWSIWAGFWLANGGQIAPKMLPTRYQNSIKKMIDFWIAPGRALGRQQWTTAPLESSVQGLRVDPSLTGGYTLPLLKGVAAFRPWPPFGIQRPGLAGQSLSGLAWNRNSVSNWSSSSLPSPFFGSCGLGRNSEPSLHPLFSGVFGKLSLC